jgi:hypothetical protein
VLERMPDYSLSAGSTRFESHMMRGPRTLPVKAESVRRRVAAPETSS